MTPEEYAEKAERIRAAWADVCRTIADMLRPLMEALAAWVREWWPLIERVLKTSRRFRAFQRRRGLRPAWAYRIRHRRLMGG